VSKSSGSEKRVLADAVLVRLTPAARAALSAAALADCVSDAAWARTQLVRLLGVDDTDNNESQPTKRYAVPNFKVPDFVVEMARLREAIGEATGALVKSAVFTRETDGHADTQALLESLIPVYSKAALEWDDIKKSYVVAYRQAKGAS